MSLDKVLLQHHYTEQDSLTMYFALNQTSSESLRNTKSVSSFLLSQGDTITCLMGQLLEKIAKYLRYLLRLIKHRVASDSAWTSLYKIGILHPRDLSLDRVHIYANHLAIPTFKIGQKGFLFHIITDYQISWVFDECISLSINIHVQTWESQRPPDSGEVVLIIYKIIPDLLTSIS